jgi:hypothetical protein
VTSDAGTRATPDDEPIRVSADEDGRDAQQPALPDRPLDVADRGVVACVGDPDARRPHIGRAYRVRIETAATPGAP